MIFLHLLTISSAETNSLECPACLFRSACVAGLWLSYLLLSVASGGSSEIPVTTAQNSKYVREHPGEPAHGSGYHSRISELCADTFRGLEGRRIKDFHLEKVFVAVTPGHTSTAPRDVIEALQGHASEKVRGYPDLLSVRKVVRGSSSKSAFKVFEALPSEPLGEPQKKEKSKTKSAKTKKGASEDFGSDKDQLSILGVIQAIKLGEYLAGSYLGRLESVVAPPGGNGRVAQTTNERVLFQTLSALLHGLFTEKQFVSADVHKVGASFCRLAGYPSSSCSASQSTFQQLEYFVHEAFKGEKHLFKDTKLSNLNVAALLQEGRSDWSAKEAIAYISNRLCAEKHHRKVESRRFRREEPMHLSSNHVELLFNISDTHISYLSSSAVFQSFAKSHSLPLLLYMDHWLTCSLHEEDVDMSEDNSCQDGNDLKIVSVSPLSMLSLLSSLALPHSRHILPASRLVIEVFHMQLREPKHGLNQAQLSSEKLSLKLGESPQNDTVPSGNLEPQIVANIKKMSSIAGSEKLILPAPPLIPMGHEEEHSLTDAIHYKKASTINERMSGNTLASQYFRLLYDGQVVTSGLPGCADDPMSSLGLCSYYSLKSILPHLHSQSEEFGPLDIKSEL